MGGGSERNSWGYSPIMELLPLP
eukprot:SAG25_NODE_6699_length_537_cov_0.872146_1_plen_22_part_10